MGNTRTCGRDTFTLAHIDLQALDPFQQRLRHAADLRCDRLDCPPKIKRQFGLVKVRFRGLQKNTTQLLTLFALSNLWMARRQLLEMQGAVRPKTA